MRVELPEGYVPPQPTHPMYGYLTPQEQEAFEAEERVRLGIVPGVAAVAEAPEGAEAPAVASWAPPVLSTLPTLPALEEEPSRRSSATRTRPRRRPSRVPAGFRRHLRSRPSSRSRSNRPPWARWASTGGTPTGRSGYRPGPGHRCPGGGRGTARRTSPPRRAAEGRRARGPAATGRGSDGTRGRSAGSPSRRSRRASGLARARAMGHTGPRARVAEWQTRWLQVPVPERAWGFKSPLAHRRTSSVNAVDHTPYQGCDPPRCASRAGYPMRRARWTVRPLSSSRSSRTAANSVMCGVSRWASSCSAVSQFS